MRRIGPLIVRASFLLGLMGCGGGGDGAGGSNLGVSLTSTPPAGGTHSVVWFADGGSSGGILLVDIMARDIAGPFDAYDVEFSFDPLIVEATSLSQGGILDICAPIAVIEAENVSNGNANATGTILFSAALTGSPPPPCSLAGTATLARVTFGARNRGTSAPAFVPSNGDPHNPSGSYFIRRATPPALVPVDFFDGGALIEVTR